MVDLNCSKTWDPTIHTLDNLELLFINYSYRNTSNVWEKKGTLEIFLKTILFLPVIALSIIGNYFIIIVIIKFKNSRSRTNIFICNLAIADLFSTITFASGLVKNFYQNYILGPFFCKTESSAKVLFLLASVFTLICISCDRIIRIIKPFRKEDSTEVTYAVVITIWVVALIIALPISFWKTYRTRQWCDYLERWCKEETKKVEIYWLMILAFLVYIPLIIMTSIYSLIIFMMSNYERRISAPANTFKIKHRRKIIKMLFIYLITTAICWAPLQVTIIFRYLSAKTENATSNWYPEAAFASHFFALANSAINPIIYGIINETFRKAICISYPKLSFIFYSFNSSARKQSLTCNGNKANRKKLTSILSHASRSNQISRISGLVI